MEHRDGILQLGGPHLKTCLWCNTEFYGRKNQKYCITKHKAAANNEKRAEFNDDFNSWFNEMRYTYRALVSCLDQRTEDGWIKTSILTGKGFDPDVAAKRVVDKEGNTYMALFDIAFLVHENKQWVKFFKTK